MESASYFDTTAESFYHGLVLGMISFMRDLYADIPGYGVRKLNAAHAYGGGPLLGCNGVSIVCHGSSDARAIENAIGLAERCVAGNFVAKVTEEMTKVAEAKAAREAAAAAEAAAAEEK